MEAIKEIVSARGREGKDQFSKKTLTTSREYTQFKMFQGTKVVATLEGKNSILDAVIDEFGKEIMYTPSEDGKGFRANVPVELSPTFYAWVSTFGKNVKIVAPTEAVDGMKKFLEKALTVYE